MLHTQGSTAFQLLALLNAGGPTATAIMAHFAPICPCDPSTWIKTKLQAGDVQITSLINALIARPVVAEPALGSTSPWYGYLLSSQCVNGVLQGQYAGGGASVFMMPIPTSPSAC